MKTIIDLVTGLHFVYHQTMSDAAIARIAGAIAEPSRARMLREFLGRFGGVHARS